MMTVLDQQLVSWLGAHAESLDRDASLADSLLPLLASSHLPKVGVPESQGGSAGPISAAAGAVAALAEHSLSAAFVFWAQRALIECLLQSPNRPLADHLLPSLLDGTLAGAPGLSNAMKFLGGFDQLQTQFVTGPEGARLSGTVQWATNLRKQSFVVALAAGNAGAGNAAVFAVPHYLDGVARGPDFDLMGLGATNTAAVRLTDVALDDGWQIHRDAKVFLPRIRPAFLGLQCGLGLGLARASLRCARQVIAGPGSILVGELHMLEDSVDDFWRQLSTGLDDGRLSERPAELLDLRIRMVDVAAAAVQLELQALGGRAYLRGEDQGFARRWRELAFLPIVTPTVVQLKTQLAKSNGKR
jgi:alkylation response protein AidB-like acyl-CoA dehydrogenase